MGYHKESAQLKDLMLLLVFFYIQTLLIYAFPGTQQKKDMKTWQPVLAQQ